VTFTATAVFVFSGTEISASFAKTGALLLGVVEAVPVLEEEPVDDEEEPVDDEEELDELPPPELRTSAAFAAPAAPQPDNINGNSSPRTTFMHLGPTFISLTSQRGKLRSYS
jgi:hypothetical protein